MSNASAQLPSTPHRSRLLLLVLVGLLHFLLFFQLGAPPAGSGLDPSWSAVLSWAFANKIQFGTDLVFTYGPYGFLHPFAAFSPDTYYNFVLGQVLVDACIAAVFVIFLRSTEGRFRMLALGTYLVFLPWIYADALWLTCLCYSSVAIAETARKNQTHWLALAITVSTPLAALLGLVKFSLLPLTALWAFSSVLGLWSRGFRRHAIALAATYAGGTALLWLLAGQSPADFPSYLRNSFDLALTYGSTMGVSPSGRHADLLGFLGMAVAGAWLGWQVLDNRRNLASAFACFFIGCVVYFAWRAGFTRADANHVTQALSVIPIALAAALCLSGTGTTARGRNFGLACLVASGALGFWVISYNPPSLQSGSISARLQQMKGVRSSFDGLTHLQAQVANRRDNWNRLVPDYALPKIRAAIGNEPVDMFMWEQGVVLLNGFNYSPRPVFQSYTAYSPKLLRLNERYFTGDAAPKWVIFKLQPIDGRLPASEDSLALLALLHRYRPYLEENGYQLLKRDAGPAAMSAISEPAPTSYLPGKLDNWITLPAAGANGAMRIAFINTSNSLAGKLHGMWFRGTSLTIEVRTSDGRQQRFRLPQGNARAGFLLSPLIVTTEDFVLAYSHAERLPVVTQFRVVSTAASEATHFVPDMSFSLARDEPGLR